MKTKKIILLSVTSVVSILPIITMTSMSCNKNIVNSSQEEIVNPDDKPSVPDNFPDNSTPITPTPDKSDTPDISVENNYDKTLNPVVSNVIVNSLKDKFEVTIEGSNLPLDVTFYSFKKSILDNDMFAQEVKEGSTRAKVTLVIIDSSFQNTSLSLSIKFGEFNQYDYIYPNTIDFKYFGVTDNQFNAYVNEFNTIMNEALNYAKIASDHYAEIYNWIDSMFSITTDTRIRVTGSKQIQTYPLVTAYDIKKSVAFDATFLIESDSMAINLSFKFWNPNPKVDVTNMSNAAKTSDGIFFIKDTIVGYDEKYVSTNKDVKIDSILEGVDINGKVY